VAEVFQKPAKGFVGVVGPKRHVKFLEKLWSFLPISVPHYLNTFHANHGIVFNTKGVTP
jgi:hypothetical protein